MNVLVLLAGCGLGDGSCIEEVVLTYLALEKHGCSYEAAALDMQAPSVNHISEEPEEMRNVLTESARIGRGRIRSLACIDPDAFDALLLPGGIGLLANYSSQKSVRQLIDRFAETGRPIASMCAGLDFLRRHFGEDLLQDAYETLAPDSFCFDERRNIYYTPAFRKARTLCEVNNGIDAMICAMCRAGQCRNL